MYGLVLDGVAMGPKIFPDRLHVKEKHLQQRDLRTMPGLVDF